MSKVSIVPWFDAKTDPPRHDSQRAVLAVSRTTGVLDTLAASMLWTFRENYTVWCDPRPPVAGERGALTMDDLRVLINPWEQPDHVWDTACERLRHAIEEADRA